MAIFHVFFLVVFVVHSTYALTCTSCEEALCVKPVNCKGGVVKGVCGCCDVCAKIQNERCGGPWLLHGRCAKGLKCVSRTRMKNENDFLPKYFQTGVCEPDACEAKTCGFREKCKANKRGKLMCFCPRKCRKRRQPVCGLLNGKEYRNKCELTREECLTKKEIGFVVGSCKKCTFKGKEYKFGDTRPDVKPCEVCVCHHSSWKCHMKQNCSTNNVSKATNKQYSCLISPDGDIVLPCPKSFSCKVMPTAKKLVIDHIGMCREGVCKKKNKCKYKRQRYNSGESRSSDKPCEICICQSSSWKCREKQNCHACAKTHGWHGEWFERCPQGFSCELSHSFKKLRVFRAGLFTQGECKKKNEFQAGTKTYSIHPSTGFVSTVKPSVKGLQIKQLKGVMVHVCMAKADTGTCRPATLIRWFYNASSQTCEQFPYSGCGGNFNNFLSKKNCVDICCSDMHRRQWQSTPTTQSSQLHMTTKMVASHKGDILMEMCHDIKTGMSYRDGEKWNVDECTSCTCVSGRALCIAARCHVSCSRPIHIKGKCCPVCESDLEHSGKAVDNKETSCKDTKSGLWYHSGESWNRSECVLCICFDGEISCMSSICTKPLCKHPAKKDGVCCPYCPEDERQVPQPTAAVSPRCKDEGSGQYYSPGEAWRVSDCVSCFCGNDGQNVCHELTCLKSKCENPVHLQGRCCPVCPESFLSACTYDNHQYFQGDFMLLGDMCTLCKCNGNAWNCTKKHCNETVNGINSILKFENGKANNNMQDPSSISNIPETPGVSLDDFSSEDNDEFIVEDPMRMTRRSTQRPVLQSTKHSTTATSSNHKVSATSLRSPKIDVSDAVEVLSQASSGTNDVQKKPRMITRDDPGSNPERQPLLKDYENRMWSSDFKGYVHPYPGKENHTTVYRTKL